MEVSLSRRMRRNRRTAALRALCAETRLELEQLVFPLFVHGKKQAAPISAMPDMYRHGQDSLLREIEACLSLGLRAFALFPVLEASEKDARGSQAVAPEGLYLRTLRKVRATFPEALLISDVALDPYSSDGHDGLLTKDGHVLNDETLPLLGDMAVLQAKSGADLVAPSDMMDGRVGYIRRRLDAAGCSEVGILAYTAKYASSLYGPFREALDSAPRKGDKKTYQMDPHNQREALEEAKQDYEEGADIIMVKPAAAYLDVVQRLSDAFDIPVAAYQVSGEYAMLKAAAAAGWAEENELIRESLIAIRRAGARLTISYFAKQVAKDRILGK